MVALGYIRRSHKSDEQTVSLQEQEAQVRDYCQRKGWTLAEVLADDGVKGANAARWPRLWERLKDTKAHALVVYHQDRLARDSIALKLNLIRMAQQGIEVHAVNRGHINGASSTDRLITGVMAEVDEYHRLVTSEKTIDGLARKRANGERWCRRAYGWTWERWYTQANPRKKGDPPNLATPVPEEQAILERIRAERQAGRSIRAIAAGLVADGIPGPSGNGWGAKTVWKLARSLAPG